jgi:hypothetical protein
MKKIHLTHVRFAQDVGGQDHRSANRWAADAKTQLFYVPDWHLVVVIDHHRNVDGAAMYVPQGNVVQMTPDLKALAAESKEPRDELPAHPARGARRGAGATSTAAE